jgi:protein TonB
MSTTRFVTSSSLVALACASSLALTLHAFPLPPIGWLGDTTSPQGLSQDPGPLERTAYVAPRDMAPPPRVTYVAPAIPSWVGDVGDVGVTLRLVLDAEGRVAEVRAIDLHAAGIETGRSEAVVGALTAAVRQWRFARPAAAPVAVTAPVMVVATSRDGATQYSLQERPIAIVLKPADYPEADEQAKTEGTAVVEVSVDPAGRVSATRLVTATTPAMGESAIAALKASTFQPGMKDGTPVPVVVTISIRFALK